MRKKIFRTLLATALVFSVFAANALPAFAEGATVTGSDVNLRSGPGTNYKVLDCLPKGASVNVTDSSNSSWYAVDYDGTSGFISSHYLKLAGSGAQADSGASGKSGYINAMYVRFRTGPSTDHKIINTYNQGKALTITGSNGDWTACTIDGKAGYVSSQYVSLGTASSAPKAEPEPEESDEPDDPYADDDVVIGGGSHSSSSEPDTPSQPQSPSGKAGTGSDVVIGGDDSESAPPKSEEPKGGNNGVVVGGEDDEDDDYSGETSTPAPSTPSKGKTGTINGDDVCFRTGPGTNYKVITTYNRGKAVTITGSNGDWTACTIDGKAGYVFSQYVKVDGGSDETGEPEEETPAPSKPSGSSEPGYITGNNVRLRSGPSMSSKVLDELFYGNSVTITGTSGDWTAVTYNGQDGYVYSQYVAKGEYKHTSSGGNSELGREIADYALQFVGYNYCWGGTSPSTGFDCSGLMYYVYQHFGYTLNRVADAQARNGVHVDPSDLQPGDLLCFYSSGSYIGHVGMYIGNNQFVHAANSNMGVIISDLSGYYAQRGYEARRII